MRFKVNPIAVAAKARQRGLRWLWRKIARELRAPETIPGGYLLHVTRPVVEALRAPARAIRGILAGGRRTEDDTLFLFYDLDVSPITYDFLWALVTAEIKRRALGLFRVHVVFVPGTAAGLRDEEDAYERAVGPDARRLRIHDLLVPACALLPSCSGHSVCATRAQAAALFDTVVRHFHPERYSPTFPVPNLTAECLNLIRGGADPFVLAAPPQARVRVRKWIDAHAQGRQVVTITLRDQSFQPQRNSNPAAWAAFARGLDPSRFLPVVVPDTAAAFGSIRPEYQGLTLFAPAAVNLPLRAALYEQAYLNLGVCTGPLTMAAFMRESRYIMFKMTAEGAPHASDTTIRWHGFEIGASLPFATAGQKWVWEDDDLATIRREFSAMTERPDGGGNSPA